MSVTAMNSMDGNSMDSSELRDLYQSLILDHARSPRHFGTLPQATHDARGINPLCGDRLHLYLQVDEQGRIEDAAFDGTGCAISVASASLLTETVIGRDRQSALDYMAALVQRLKGESDGGEDLGKLQALQGVREFPSRVKCATLAWHALHSALNQDSNTVTTE